MISGFGANDGMSGLAWPGWACLGALLSGFMIWVFAKHHRARTIPSPHSTVVLAGGIAAIMMAVIQAILDLPPWAQWTLFALGGWLCSKELRVLDQFMAHRALGRLLAHRDSHPL